MEGCMLACISGHALATRKLRSSVVTQGLIQHKMAVKEWPDCMKACVRPFFHISSYILSDDIIPVHITGVFRSGNQFLDVDDIRPFINHLILHRNIFSDDGICQYHAAKCHRISN